MADFDRDSMLDMFVYEMNHLIESLEGTVLKAETGFGQEDINEIFRVMHTIKGSSAMMLFDTMSQTAHAIEDMFFYLREENPKDVDSEKIADVVLESMDFIKSELAKVEAGLDADGINDEIVEKIKVVLAEIKGDSCEVSKEEVRKYEVKADLTKDKDEFIKERELDYNTFLINIRLIDSCEMKNIRAYTNISNLEGIFNSMTYTPSDILSESTEKVISENGYDLKIKAGEDSAEVLKAVLNTSYTDYISFRKITMGDSSQKLTDLNKYDVQVVYTNGYGDAFSNILESIRAIDYDIAYFNCDKIVVEGENANEIIFTIYTELGQIEIEEKIVKFPNIKDINFLKLDEYISDEQKLECVDSVQIQEVLSEQEVPKINDDNKSQLVANADTKRNAPNQVISVGINKLDQLLNLMGELVIAEAMVTQNPELDGLELESFHKEARQLHKIINDVQDVVMGMRMVPLSSVFFKMHRIVRDMSKQLSKEVELIVVGEETEVDKNIIEHISDPLMHMIRNSIDHGIESEDDRLRVGKSKKGTVVLEAKNSGGDVLIIIKDDGGGLDDKKIMKKAKASGLLKKAESEYTQKEVHQFIFQAGFSTNEQVTNYSGRGVGMDVVINNLQLVGGSVEVSSVLGQGSEFTLKIPLTLAIIEGMIISLAGAYYTIPIISIRQQFKAEKSMISVDPSGNEMITTNRGDIYNLIRLSEFFGVESSVNDIEDGIIICIENGNKSLCLFVDSLVGERQVVVKSMPKYIKEIRGISGCTLLGNGDISLIIDVAGFFDK